MLAGGFFLLLCAMPAPGASSAAAQAVDLSNRGRPEEGAARFEEAIREDPKNAKLRLGLGLAYQELKRYKEAIKALEEAARLAPNLTEAHYSLGLLYESMAINPGLAEEGKGARRGFWLKARQAWSAVRRLDKKPERQKAAKEHLDRIDDELREAS